MWTSSFPAFSHSSLPPSLSLPLPPSLLCKAYEFSISFFGEKISHGGREKDISPVLSREGGRERLWQRVRFIIGMKQSTQHKQWRAQCIQAHGKMCAPAPLFSLSHVVQEKRIWKTLQSLTPTFFFKLPFWSSLSHMCSCRFLRALLAGADFSQKHLRAADISPAPTTITPSLENKHTESYDLVNMVCKFGSLQQQNANKV